MTFTTMIILNAALDLLVIVALFRLVRFGVSARYGVASSVGEHDLQAGAENQRLRRAAVHERHAA